MAEIVAAMAMTHSPGLTGWFDRASEEHQQLALGATAAHVLLGTAFKLTQHRGEVQPQRVATARHP